MPIGGAGSPKVPSSPADKKRKLEADAYGAVVSAPPIQGWNKIGMPEIFYALLSLLTAENKTLIRDYFAELDTDDSRTLTKEDFDNLKLVVGEAQIEVLWKAFKQNFDDAVGDSNDVISYQEFEAGFVKVIIDQMSAEETQLLSPRLSRRQDHRM
jgi:hypothetical protein